MTTWLTDTVLATSALILLVLLVRRPVAHWFGPKIAYCLWVLPALRLVMPPLVLPKAAAPAEEATGPIVATELSRENGLTTYVASGAENLPVAAAAPRPEAADPALALVTSPDFANVALSVWAGVALALIVWRLGAYFSLRRELLADARVLASSGDVRIIESSAIRAPMAFGIYEQYIALPEGFFACADDEAVELAIAHELEHHKGNDLAANFVLELVVALLWFNPLAWIARGAMRSDQEAACDARVLAAAGEAYKARYAELIADFAIDQRFAMASHLGSKPVIHRLRCIAGKPHSRRRTRAGRVAVLMGALALPATATVTYAASDKGTRTIMLAPGAAAVAALSDFRPETDSLPDRAEEVDAAPLTQSELRIDRSVTEEGTAVHTLRRENGIVESDRYSFTPGANFARVPHAPAPPVPPAPPSLMHVVHGMEGQAERLARMQPVQLECNGQVTTLTVAEVQTREGERAIEAYARCIERHAARAEARALAQADAGLEQGLVGLLQARRSVEKTRFPNEEMRREVLRDIDEDIRDLREEIREVRRHRDD